MLKNIKNLKGITLLEKEQKTFINGGSNANLRNCDHPETWLYDMSQECERAGY